MYTVLPQSPAVVLQSSTFSGAGGRGINCGTWTVDGQSGDTTIMHGNPCLWHIQVHTAVGVLVAAAVVARAWSGFV